MGGAYAGHYGIINQQVQLTS